MISVMLPLTLESSYRAALSNAVLRHFRATIQLTTVPYRSVDTCLPIFAKLGAPSFGCSLKKKAADFATAIEDV